MVTKERCHAKTQRLGIEVNISLQNLTQRRQGAKISDDRFRSHDEIKTPINFDEAILKRGNRRVINNL